MRAAADADCCTGPYDKTKNDHVRWAESWIDTNIGRRGFETIEKLQGEVGLTIILVEQNAEASLNVANYVYTMHEGQIKSEGTSKK